jgi:hypothetical protein
MKRSCFLLFSVFIVSSCYQTNTARLTRDVAIDSVKAYLTKTLNDPSSYQPVEFGNIEPQMSSYKLEEEYDYYNGLAKDSTDREKYDKSTYYALYKKRKSENYYEKLHELGVKKLDSLQKFYKPKLLRYYLYKV